MTLPSSGPLTLGQLQSEFGGPSPIVLENYYRGGSYVPNISPNNSIPTSGAIVLPNDFWSTMAGFGTIVIAGVSVDISDPPYYTGTEYGYQTGSFGTLTSCSVTFGSTCNGISSTIIDAGGSTTYTTTLQIPNSSNPGKSAWNTMTISGSAGGPLSSSSSTYSYSGGVAEWSWGTVGNFLTLNGTFTITFT